ncbi:hypothetical protein BGZ94_008777 [Podila epigama]|nr:hypothetical protein BGZ94_008777 [Podila epigama]
MEAFFQEKHAGPTTRVKEYLWPDINQEDLLKPKLLLFFLNSGARHFPSVFAAADDDSFRFAFTAGKVMPCFLNHYTMMFTDHNTPESYDRLYNCDQNEEAFQWMMSRRGTNVGTGLQVLQVQEAIYKFLVDCCLHILQVTRQAALADDGPIEPEPPALPLTDGPSYSLSDVAAATPYLTPAKIDLNRLRQLLAAKRSAAEDHAWSLREDPGYFADTVLEMKEHRQELLPDIYGYKHSLVTPRPSKEFWNRVVGKVVAEAIGFLEYEGKLKEKDPLPEELLDAFLELDYSLNMYMNAPLTSLKHIMIASPPMRVWFVRMPERNPRNIEVIPHQNKPIVDATQQRFMWLFQVLIDDQKRHLSGVLPLLDNMERLVQADPKSRNLFSSKVADTVTDYSLFAECQRQINLFQPWAATFETEAASKDDKLKNDYIERTKRMAVMEGALQGIDNSDGEPSDKKFYYPVDKRRTKETTEAMQQAEANLDAFWNRVDRVVNKALNDAKCGTWTSVLRSGRTLQRTPDWVEPLPKVADKNKKGTPVNDLLKDLEYRSEQVADKDEPKQVQKSKVKTRGEAVPKAKTPATEQLVSSGEASKVDVQPIFKLDKRALKVFSTLFYQPTPSAQPGEIPWNDFLYAMGATGFEMEKLYGSVWHFTPTRLDVERSIQFHEPHPIGKIPFRNARRMGRRLFRNYGWHGDMFQPAE